MIGRLFYSFKKNFTLLFLPIIAFISIENPVYCINNNNLSFLEADSIKDYSGNGRFVASGHVVLKKDNILFNADEMEIVKKIANNKTNYTFKANNWVKIRTITDNFIFAKSMLYNENKQDGYINNALIIPRQLKNDKLEIYATKITKNNHIFTFENINICPCKFLSDKNIENNKNTPFNLIKGFDGKLYDELIESPASFGIKDTEKNILNDFNSSLLTFNSAYATYDTKKHQAIFDKIKIKLFGTTIFYWPFKYKLNTDKTGDSGFLAPSFVMLGFRQVGFELPLYFKLSNNIDLYLSRSQYFNLGSMFGLNDSRYTNTTDDRYKLKDLNNKRNSTTQFRFRHLLSNKNNYNSFYTISGMLIDRGQLLDENTGLGLVDDYNRQIQGYRWYIDLKSKIKLSKTTFLSADFNLSSDRNVLYYYLYDSRLIKDNNIHLYDIDENRYISASVYNYQSNLLKIDQKTTPFLIPIVQIDYKFKKDRFGGNFYINSKGTYLHRNQGYNTTIGIVDLGYHLPKIFKNGTKLTFDTLLRNQYSYFKYINIDNMPISPLLNLNDSTTFYYGNYNWLSQLNNYSTAIKDNFNNFLPYSFNKIQLEHPFIISSSIGKTIISPKLALRYSPNSGKISTLPAEDSLLMNFNYYNAFDLMQSGGFGVYDTGLSVVYGGKIEHKFNKNIDFSIGIAHNTRITNEVDNNILADFTGFNKRFSDITTDFSLRIYNFKIGGYFNYDVYNNNIRFANLFASFNYKTYLLLSLSYNYFSKSSTIFNYDFDVFSIYGSFSPNGKFKIFGGIKSNFITLLTVNGEQTPQIFNYHAGISMTFGCFELGFEVIKFEYNLANIQDNTVYRVIFNFLGFG